MLLSQVSVVVGLHTPAIFAIEEQMLGLFGVKGGDLVLIASAIGTAGIALNRANQAKDKAEEIITKANNTSNFIIDISNIISTRIDHLNGSSVPTVANVFPLLNNSHFEQISDGSSPNNISIKNINSSGRFEYEYLNFPPFLTNIIIFPILEPTSNPPVAKITINSEYKYMSFTYYTGATNRTLYYITFNEITECDILIVGGGGAGGNAVGGGGGAGGVVYTVNQKLNGTYSIWVGNGGLGLTMTTNVASRGIEQNGADSFIRNADNTADISLNMGGTSQYLRGFGGGTGGVNHASLNNGVNGGSGGGSSEHLNAAKIAGTSIQPNTYWDGASYIKGGNAGNTNQTINEFFIAGGGGGLGGVSDSYVDGKSGLSINITGTSQSYAGGGGGGQYITTADSGLASLATSRGIGGSSIGGNGRIFKEINNTYLRDPTNGINGTGSGGGGGTWNNIPQLEAGSGGSGIVIIRYKYLNIIPAIQQTGFLNYTHANGWSIDGLEQNAIIKSLSDRIASLGG